MATGKNWFPIFKKGNHISSSKKSYEATVEKLDKIVAANQGKDIPLAIGHPKGAFTKFGSAPEFKREGEILYARPKEVHAEFEGWVNDGYLQGVSISLNDDFTLNHIGFLGAKAPAVDLPSVQFQAPDDAMVVEFSDWRMNTVGRLFQRLREFLIEKYGKDEADKVISNYEIEDIEREPMKPEAANSFSKPHKEAGMKTAQELETELATERQRTKKLEDDLALERRTKQRQDFSAFLEGKVKIGNAEIDMTTKVTPAMKPAILDLMEFMAGTETYEFAATDGKTEKKSPVEVFKTIVLPNLMDQVGASEFARHDNAGKKKTEEQEVVAGIASASPKPEA